MDKREFFKIEGDKINRIRKHCPKCGPGVFIAEHNDRFSCGKCGYTEFKSSGHKEVKPLKVEQPKIEKVDVKPSVEDKSKAPKNPVQEAEPLEENKK